MAPLLFPYIKRTRCHRRHDLQILITTWNIQPLKRTMSFSEQEVCIFQLSLSGKTQHFQTLKKTYTEMSLKVDQDATDSPLLDRLWLHKLMPWNHVQEFTYHDAKDKMQAQFSKWCIAYYLTVLICPLIGLSD